MKQGTGWKVAIVVFIFLSAFADISQSAEPNNLSGNLTGEIRYRYEYIGVDGDAGRFREDNWMTDRSTGGIDWLHLENVRPAEDEYKVILEGKALHDYDYDMSLLLEKENSHYLKFDFDSKRRYYDGSNEFWNSPNKGLLEMPDGDYFVDRRNYNIEVGLTPPDKPHFIFGWHRLEKDGKEVILRGSEAPSGVPDPLFVPGVVNMRGITDTFYGEVSHTFAEKYNLRIRQEFEQHHDRQRSHVSEYTVYDSGGNVTSDASTLDDLGYTNWRTMAMFDSFLDEKTYVTANYMYNYLNNDSTRTFWRPALYVDELDVGNSKRTNVTGLGYRKADVLQVKGLDLSAGVRIEDSKTEGESLWFYSGSNFMTRSTLDEVRVAESIRLVYKAMKRTTLSFDADLEQRDLGWDANDTRTPASFARKTDTDSLDQIYTFKAVHRFNPAVKTTVSYKSKNLERSHTNLFDLSSGYPGWLGNYRLTGNEVLLKTDFRINNTTNTALLYQYIQEEFNFSLGGETADHQTHRGAGSISLNPTQNLFLVGTFMLENRRIFTPVTTIPTENVSTSPGSHPWDFRGNSYSLLLDGTYAFNEKTTGTLGFQHTEALGAVDDAGNYVYDKVGIALKRRFAANQTVGLGYEFYNFNNHNGGSFDDYQAHGVIVTYNYSF
ncbi:MAG: hypothetical protein ABII09_10580 [Planctomycetota bacterium]